MQAIHIDNLRNRLLIATPALQGSYFEHTLIYLCDHSENGAMGLVINQSISLDLPTIMQHFGIKTQENYNSSQRVCAGGPVEVERGFVLHQGPSWESSLKVSPTMSLTTSRDVLEAMALGQGPKKALVAMGYSGWSPGQLEQEVINNLWLPIAGEIESVLFDLSLENRFNAAIDKLGINMGHFSCELGHA